MTLPFRDKDTGLRRGVIRYPDGRPPQPSGCRWCGVPERVHYMQWLKSPGWHAWTMPTQAQIKARIRARMKAKEKK